MKQIQIAIAQLNYTAGDLLGNRDKIIDAHKQAGELGADIVLFSEMCVTGYPAEDLVLLDRFVKKSYQIVQELAEITKGDVPDMLIGSLRPSQHGQRPYNSVFLLQDGEIAYHQDKYDLPNYGVFDENRVFSAGELPQPIEYKQVKFGIMICEDMWNMKVTKQFKGADIILSINGSPFEVGKHEQRLNRAEANIKALNKPLIYVNQICGQDDLVFDGDSFVISDSYELKYRLSRTQEQVVLTSWEDNGYVWQCDEGLKYEYSSEEQIIYQAMILGLRDYVNKNGFPGVIIGMSGGIDSALSAAVAVDALGAERVRLVMMPSQYTSEESLNDAEECATMLGITLETLPIEEIFGSYQSVLAQSFTGKEGDITEENLQSRIRGMLLMALSNKFGHMVMSTGNKSEVSVGYATLYGDMCGGYNVLKDVYKQQVTNLCNWRNHYLPENGVGPSGKVIPDNIITKPPTAELRHNQKDSDSLPEYEILDPILIRLIEETKSVEEVIEEGYDSVLVRRISELLHAAEYKRRQSAPGVKISKKPFSRDRRYPITNKFSG